MSSQGDIPKAYTPSLLNSSSAFEFHAIWSGLLLLQFLQFASGTSDSTASPHYFSQNRQVIVNGECSKVVLGRLCNCVIKQWRRKIFGVGGAKRENPNYLGGSRGMLPRKIWKSRSKSVQFGAFWDCKSPTKTSKLGRGFRGHAPEKKCKI